MLLRGENYRWTSNNLTPLNFSWMYKEHKKEARAREQLAEMNSDKHDLTHIDTNGVTMIENEHVTLGNHVTLANNNMTLANNNKNSLMEQKIEPTETRGVDNQAFEY